MKVPRLIVPILILLMVASGLYAARLFVIPSVVLEFPGEPARGRDSTRTAKFLVGGVRCADTALLAGSTLNGLPGVIRYVAYASRNRVEIVFDPSLTNVEKLREAIEGPVYDEGTGRFLFHLFTVEEIDGEGVRRDAP